MPYYPRFKITPRLLALISKVIMLKTRIDQSAVQLFVFPALSRDTFVRLAHSSTAIEGNTLSLHQVSELAKGKKVDAEVKQKTEVKNYLRALKMISGWRSGRCMNEGNLLKLHRLLMLGLLDSGKAGKYKQKPNRVMGPKGETVYYPPSPEKCVAFVKEMIQWQSSKQAKELSPVVTSAILHHRLVSIHPFTDGNGRISRLWGLAYLFASEFDAHHLFALDECFDFDRQKYYDKIQQARDLDDDLTFWIEYIAECLVETLEKTLRRIAQIAMRNLKGKININSRQEQILNFLNQQGTAKSPDLEKKFKLTRSRIQQLIKPLVDAGLVESSGKTRATFYFLK